MYKSIHRVSVYMELFMQIQILIIVHFYREHAIICRFLAVFKKLVVTVVQMGN